MKVALGISLILFLSSVGCIPSLPAAKDTKKLTYIPWEVKYPSGNVDLSFGGGLQSSREACKKRVEKLRKEALEAAKAREVRRILTGLAGSGAGSTAIGLFVSSDDATDGEAIGAYISSGVGIGLGLMELLWPENRYEVQYGAWLTAMNLQNAAEDRLSILDMCIRDKDWQTNINCKSLGEPIEILKTDELAVDPEVNDKLTVYMDRFNSIGGMKTIAIIMSALDRCSRIIVEDNTAAPALNKKL